MEQASELHVLLVKRESTDKRGKEGREEGKMDGVYVSVGVLSFSFLYAAKMQGLWQRAYGGFNTLYAL